MTAERQGFRIGMVCLQAPPVYGGAGTQAVGLARELAKQGHAVDLLTQNQLGAASRESVAPNVTIRRSPLERLIKRLPPRVSRAARSFIFGLWVFRMLAGGRYHIIHLHGSYWFGIPAALVAKVYRTPLIIKVTRLGEDDAQTVAEKRIGRIPIGRLYGLGFRTADVAIALSDEIAQRHRTTFPGKRCEQIPNGVDVERFQSGLKRRHDRRAELGIARGTFLVLFVGYLAPHKGVTPLLDAWREFAVEGTDAHLLLVGPAGGFYRELDEAVSNRARADARGSSDVTVLDHVDFASMPETYAAADQFILPTKAEGMPNSLLEALASGLPSIGSSVPGVLEIAARSEKVRLVDEVNSTTLRDELRRALATHAPEDRASGLPREFELAHVASQYSALYHALRAPAALAG